jgi:large subunit ribosomal protein L21e
MKGSKGFRRRTRSLRIKPRERGKLKISRYLQRFNEGETVSISIDPSYQAIPHPRFKGRSGRVTGKQGRCYFVEIMDGKKKKEVLVAPEHLTAQKS